jgi:hypothetical protein
MGNPKIVNFWILFIYLFRGRGAKWGANKIVAEG